MADQVETDAGSVGEKPTLPVEEKKTTDEPKRDLMSTLEKYGVKAPEDFEGVLQELKTYKKGYGDRSNEVGELRKELQALRTELQPNKRVRQSPPVSDPWAEEQKPEPIDLRGEIKSTLREFWDEEQSKQQRAMEDYTRARQDIESRPTWKRIGPVFDKALNDPAVRTALQAGRITLDGLYSRLENRDLVNTVDNLLKQLPEGALKATVQTSDSADRVKQPPRPDTERKDKLKKAKEKGDVDGVIKNLFGENDPFLRP